MIDDLQHLQRAYVDQRVHPLHRVGVKIVQGKHPHPDKAVDYPPPLFDRDVEVAHRPRIDAHFIQLREQAAAAQRFLLLLRCQLRFAAEFHSARYCSRLTGFGARTAHVTLERGKLEILVEYLEGPFQQMNNKWNFRPAGDDVCDVEFFIAYEFRSRTLGVLMGTVFETAFRRFSAAFERRADDVYGAHPA